MSAEYDDLDVKPRSCVQLALSTSCRLRATSFDVLRLAADADDKCLEVGILASRFAVDRVGRNDEEVPARATILSAPPAPKSTVTEPRMT